MNQHNYMRQLAESFRDQNPPPVDWVGKSAAYISLLCGILFVLTVLYCLYLS